MFRTSQQIRKKIELLEKYQKSKISKKFCQKIIIKRPLKPWDWADGNESVVLHA